MFQKLTGQLDFTAPSSLTKIKNNFYFSPKNC